jgi:transcription elongation factor GreA
MRDVRAKLLEELKSLDRELRIELPKEIKSALAMGDLRENAEYQAALERQGYVRARIGQLRKRLADLGTVDLRQVPRDRIGIGSVVTLLDLDGDQELSYELVFPELADHPSGLISIASPIGKGLIGKQDGDQVVVRVPGGEKRFEILEFKTLHDASRDPSD